MDQNLSKLFGKYLFSIIVRSLQWSIISMTILKLNLKAIYICSANISPALDRRFLIQGLSDNMIRRPRHRLSRVVDKPGSLPLDFSAFPPRHSGCIQKRRGIFNGSRDSPPGRRRAVERGKRSCSTQKSRRITEKVTRLRFTRLNIYLLNLIIYGSR